MFHKLYYSLAKVIIYLWMLHINVVIINLKYMILILKNPNVFNLILLKIVQYYKIILFNSSDTYLKKNEFI